MTDTLDYQNIPLPLSAAPQYWFAASTSGQTIVGNSGNDAIYGVGGDTLVGGTGDDTFYVAGTDQVIVAPGGGVDTIVTYWGGYTLPSNVQNLVVQGDGAYGVGNSLDNIIEAVGPGEITLDGGGGNNVLIGGTGETIFVHAVNNSNDVITNFQPGLDKVRIENTDLFTFAAIQSQMQQVGNDVVLNLAPDDSITFRNVQVGQFSAQDFMLPLDYSNLQMSFDDEFNSLSLRSGNSGTWSTAYWWAQPNGATLSTNGELEWYINSSYAPTSSVKPWTVNNGILNLTAAPASPSIQPLIDNYQYTSGMLTTHDSFVQTYGVYEINAKVPAGQGLWVDFWLVPENGSWPPELDVMEINGGNPTSLNTGIHSASTGTSTSIGTDTPIPDASAGFHTYTVDWEPNTITWYFDHNEVFQTATPADMHQPMYMLLDLAVGGPYGNPNSSTQLPANFEVNYVHVYATTADTGPVETVSNLTAAHGESFAASSLFSYSDPVGSAVTEYDFWDTGTGGGYFALNGTALGANQNNIITAAQLSQLTYQSGSGADTLWVRANDGTLWGPWSNAFTVTAPIDTGPVETVSNLTAAHGESFAASSLFSYSDPVGSAVTEYDFWDTGTGGGYFALNGTALGANQNNIITAAQLSQLTYQSGSGADTLWVRANDGTLWGPWSNAFTVTAPIDTGPVETPVNSSILSTQGESFAASSLFSYSDPVGNAVTEYDFWDTGTGGGYFALNGTALGANQNNTITAAQLSQLTYHVGSGTDTLWVRANDGTVWGPWSNSFTISDPATIEAGATLELPSAFSGNVTFAGSTGTLQLDSSSSFSGTVAGMSDQDILDLRDISPVTVATPTFSGNSSGGTLTVTDGAHSANIALLGNYLASTFVATSDGHGGTNIVDSQLISSTPQTLVTHPQHV